VMTVRVGEDDQAYLGARATSGPGDKMMDWVPPARGGLRPLILWRPSAGPCTAEPALRADSRVAGAGRVDPHRLTMASPFP